jgi:hypothetical protein
MAKKAREHELLSDQNIAKVIGLLSQEKPITKKAACELLNISYNTSRLDSIIKEYKERKAYAQEQREKKRYTPATKQEIEYVVTSYMEGAAIQHIADHIYRSSNFVTNTIDRLGVPRRHGSADYWNPELVPEAAQRDSFVIGEKVWAARYNSLAEIEAEVPNQPGVYRIWLLAEEWQQKAYQPYWELASLEHLKQQGINL